MYKRQVLVNGFGSTPLQELYLFNYAVAKVLHEKNIRIYRSFAGNYMTSIDMLGASLTFMKMNAELKELLDQESEAPAFSVKGHVPEIVLEEEIRECKEEDLTEESYKACAEVRNEKITLENIVYMVETMSHCIIKNEIPFRCV